MSVSIFAAAVAVALINCATILWMQTTFEQINKRLDRLGAGMDRINTTLEKVAGSLRDLDTRLAHLEGRLRAERHDP